MSATAHSLAARVVSFALTACLAIAIAGATPGAASAGDLRATDVTDAPAAITQHSDLEVRDHALALGVDDRRPLDPGTRFDVGDQVYAWVSVANPHAESHVTLVWNRDGVARWSIDLDVGHSTRGWRTWAYKTMRPGDTGVWTVDVVAPDGSVLDTLSFEIGGETDTTLGAAHEARHEPTADAEAWTGTVGDVATGC